VVRGIADETVRRYYGQDFTTRLRQLLMPKQNWERNERPRGGGFGSGRPGNFREYSRGKGGPWQGGRANMREPISQASTRLAGSPIVRGYRSALPPREALILMAVINHPWLLEQHAEEFSELEFLNPDADQLRRAILEAAIDAEAAEAEKLRAEIAGRGLGAALARAEAAITHTSDWPARAGAGGQDVAQWWTHVVTLHRKQRTLNRELKEAERALGEEPSEGNLAWLQDVQGRLSALDGSEAQIEGFGASSGRPVRSV
jgi:DNA primase